MYLNLFVIIASMFLLLIIFVLNLINRLNNFST